VISGSLATSMFPRLSMQAGGTGQSSSGEAQELARRSFCFLAAALAPLYVVAIFAMRPFLVRWVGPSLAQQSATVGEILLAAWWINGLAQVPYTALQAKGRPDLTAKFHLLELPPFVFLLWVGLRVAGVEGAAAAWGVRVTIDTVLLCVAAKIPKDALVAACPGLLLVAISLAVVIADASNDAVRLMSFSFLFVCSAFWAWRSVPAELRRNVWRKGEAFRLGRHTSRSEELPEWGEKLA
jgi:O-antigen/teichoic acid export membrane protein